VCARLFVVSTFRDFLFSLILHASDVCKYLKFLSIFFPSSFLSRYNIPLESSFNPLSVCSTGSRLYENHRMSKQKSPYEWSGGRGQIEVMAVEGGWMDGKIKLLFLCV